LLRVEPLEELEKAVLAADWGTILRDAPPRKEIVARLMRHICPVGYQEVQ
jgi:hypothetical protein